MTGSRFAYEQLYSTQVSQIFNELSKQTAPPGCMKGAKKSFKYAEFYRHPVYQTLCLDRSESIHFSFHFISPG